MYCPNCGKEIPDGSKFCPYCGTKVEQGEIVYKGKGNLSSSSFILNILMQIMAGLLVLISIAILIESFVISGRIRNFVSTSQIMAFANELGAPPEVLQNPIFLQILKPIQNAASGISRFLTLNGLIIFVTLCLIGLIAFAVVSINKRLDKIKSGV